MSAELVQAWAQVVGDVVSVAGVVVAAIAAIQACKARRASNENGTKIDTVINSLAMHQSVHQSVTVNTVAPAAPQGNAQRTDVQF